MDLSGDGSITLDRRAFKALASETRVEILKLLDGTQKTVSDLAREMDMNKATMFQHLEQLLEVGLVKKDGAEERATTIKEVPFEAPVQGPPKKWVYYRLSWKGRNILHPERVKIALMLSLTAIALAAVAVIYILAASGPGPGPGAGDSSPPLVVSWGVGTVNSDSGTVDVQISVADNRTGRVSGLNVSATVLRWGIASGPALPSPDIVPWTELDYSLQADLVRAYVPALEWGARLGNYLVLSVSLKDLAGNSAAYYYSERIAPARAPDLTISPTGIGFDRAGSDNHYTRLSVLVQNTGNAVAANLTVALFVSDPDPGQNGRVLPGAFAVGTEVVPKIQAGGSVTLDFTVPSNRLTTRYLYAMADPYDNITELDEMNNVAGGRLPSGVPPPLAKPTAGKAPGMELLALVLSLGAALLLARRRSL